MNECVCAQVVAPLSLALPPWPLEPRLSGAPQPLPTPLPTGVTAASQPLPSPSRSASCLDLDGPPAHVLESSPPLTA